MSFLVRECTHSECRFRFPASAAEVPNLPCPHCQSPTTIEADYASIARRPPSLQPPTPIPHLEIVLDNLRSIYNVGSIFRTADGAGVRHLHLCGITATPAHPKLAKTSLGADAAVSWTHHRNGVAAVEALKARGYQIWALEDTAAAEPLFAQSLDASSQPLALILGNERAGIDPALLTRSDRVLYLPMLGQKESLNVTIALGAAVYHLLHNPPHE